MTEEEIEEMIGGDPSSVDSWMPKLLDAMKADDSQLGDVAEKAGEVIKENVVKAVKSA